jgi:cell division protein FtsB
MTKSLLAALAILFLLLQYKLWFDSDGIRNIWHLHQHIHEQTLINKELKRDNLVLRADVLSLKNGEDAIEERARYDLGMVKRNEVFVNLRQ